MGLSFTNAIGLAAGLDKNGDYIDCLSALGFGFIEIGTVTLKPQKGNKKPRLFRIPAESALLNRMGFNNRGVDSMIKRLQKTEYRGVLGINIGKNKDTSLADATSEYVSLFLKLWPYASYFTINISSPNTENLRLLQEKQYLDHLLFELKQTQLQIKKQHHKYVPLVLKISPDLSLEELNDIISIVLKHCIEGVIATNTTLNALQNEMGGISGKPLFAKSTTVLEYCAKHLQKPVVLIASGGIMNEATAKEKLSKGAHLLQIYTGLIYEGPTLIKRILSL